MRGPERRILPVQLHHDGVTSLPADNSRGDGVRTVASLLADRLRIHTRWTGLIEEHPATAGTTRPPQEGRDEPVKADQATQVHRTKGRAITGDDPRNLVASCAACNQYVGRPSEPWAPTRRVSSW